jgi:hypothetical protein
MAVWLGVPDVLRNPQVKEDIMSGKFSAKMTQKVATKASVKLTGKLVTKMIDKLSVKLASKASSFIPVVGSAASGAINRMLMEEITQAAETYYEQKFRGMRNNAGLSRNR